MAAAWCGMKVMFSLKQLRTLWIVLGSFFMFIKFKLEI